MACRNSCPRGSPCELVSLAVVAEARAPGSPAAGRAMSRNWWAHRPQNQASAWLLAEQAGQATPTAGDCWPAGSVAGVVTTGSGGGGGGDRGR